MFSSERLTTRFGDSGLELMQKEAAVLSLRPELYDLEQRKFVEVVFEKCGKGVSGLPKREMSGQRP